MSADFFAGVAIGAALVALVVIALKAFGARQSRSIFDSTEWRALERSMRESLARQEAAAARLDLECAQYRKRVEDLHGGRR